MSDSTPPGGRARLSQERSRVRRDQLITAAATLFAEGGTKAVTHRSVSEAADVPLATVSYYFASIEQLVDVVFSETLT
ncbi:MAG: TetR family transcriptional regulator, partial [Actinomycetales bacterium]